MIALVAAIASNYAIGKNNQLLWHITEDLKHFKAITTGGTVVMGRKTFESIGRPLPNRRNIVVTRSHNLKIEGVEVANSLEGALDLAKADGQVYIIGGGEIYHQSIQLADTLYITWVGHDFEGDAFFPQVDLLEWEEVERQDFSSGLNFEYPFSFLTYKKIKK